MMRFERFLLSTSQRLNSVRLPAKGVVQLLTTLFVISLCLFPALAEAASAHVYDAPQVGPPTSATMLVGNGFDPNATLDFYFDSTNVGFIVTDSHGSFGLALAAPTIREGGATIHVPKDAVPGAHTITAVERITQLQAQVAFTVRTDWAQYHFDTQHTGFNPYENVLNPSTVPNLQAAWNSDQNGGSPSTVANGVVYSESPYYLEALDASTGVPVWELSFIQGAAPVVANGVVYVGSVSNSGWGNIYALNASTGAQVWKYAQDTAAGLTVANGVLYATSYVSGRPQFYLTALDTRTGSLIWKYPTPNQLNGKPAVANGLVYVSSGDGTVYALNATTSALFWQYATGSYVGTSPVVANGMVYIFANSGALIALDASTGSLQWSYQTGFSPGGSPAVANGVVYFGSGDNNVYALNASTGAFLWKYLTGGAAGEPAVANGVVYINVRPNLAGDYNVYALNAGTGALLWRYKAPNQPEDTSSPVVVNGMVYFGCDGTLYALGLPNSNPQSNTVVTPSK